MGVVKITRSIFFPARCYANAERAMACLCVWIYHNYHNYHNHGVLLQRLQLVFAISRHIATHATLC